MHPDKKRIVLCSLGLLGLIFFCLLLLGCTEDEVPSIEQAVPEPAQIEKPKPAHFILCIDNSRSIKPPEQVLIHEAAMLLADLVEFEDRISVVTFGVQARVAAQREIRSDDDRKLFKKQISQQVDFTENYSDIRAGYEILSKDTNSPLAHEGYCVASSGIGQPLDRL